MLLVRVARNARLLSTTQVARALASDASQRLLDPGARERQAPEPSVSSLLRPTADSLVLLFASCLRSQELGAHLDNFEEEELDGDETFLATARAASEEAAANPALQASGAPRRASLCVLPALRSCCVLCGATENRACGRHRRTQRGEEHVDKHAGRAAGAQPGDACVHAETAPVTVLLLSCARCRRCLGRRTRRVWRRWGPPHLGTPSWCCTTRQVRWNRPHVASAAPRVL
jgi:hypothetical protein